MLEYVRLAVSLAGIGTLLFGALQWMSANRTAEQANQIATRTMYERISTDWREHTQTFVRQPDLWPYFELGKELNKDDPNRNLVLAVADIRLDVMDAILTVVAIQPFEFGVNGWRNTFDRAFRTSPALCARVAETEESWVGAQILPHWRHNCRKGRR